MLLLFSCFFFWSFSFFFSFLSYSFVLLISHQQGLNDDTASVRSVGSYRVCNSGKCIQFSFFLRRNIAQFQNLCIAIFTLKPVWNRSYWRHLNTNNYNFLIWNNITWHTNRNLPQYSAYFQICIQHRSKNHKQLESSFNLQF